MIRTTWSRPWVVWLACSVAGTVLIALPDPDRRLFSISESHGPGLTDFLGAVLLVAGWVVLDVQVWLGRRRLLTMGWPRLLLLAVAALAGAAVIVWSVEGDAGMWWLMGALVLAGVQVVAAARATGPWVVRRGSAPAARD